MKDEWKNLSKYELEIMKVVWDAGRASIREILEALQDQRRPAYTTVQTVVGRLEEKGALRRAEKIGNAYIYEPIISRPAVTKRLINELLDLFGGSARPLMAHLASTGHLSLKDIRELEDMVVDVSANDMGEDR